MRKTLGLNDEKMIFGVDRLDYTKGIPDRLKAFARLLEQHPEWRTRVTMVQVGAPSREHLKRYQALMSEVQNCVDDDQREVPRRRLAAGHLSPAASPARGRWRTCIAPPTCAWCRRCTTA